MNPQEQARLRAAQDVARRAQELLAEQTRQRLAAAREAERQRIQREAATRREKALGKK